MEIYYILSGCRRPGDAAGRPLPPNILRISQTEILSKATDAYILRRCPKALKHVHSIAYPAIDPWHGSNEAFSHRIPL